MPRLRLFLLQLFRMTASTLNQPVISSEMSPATILETTLLAILFKEKVPQRPKYVDASVQTEPMLLNNFNNLDNRADAFVQTDDNADTIIDNPLFVAHQMAAAACESVIAEDVARQMAAAACESVIAEDVARQMAAAACESVIAEDVARQMAAAAIRSVVQKSYFSLEKDIQDAADKLTGANKCAKKRAYECLVIAKKYVVKLLSQLWSVYKNSEDDSVKDWLVEKLRYFYDSYMAHNQMMDTLLVQDVEDEQYTVAESLHRFTMMYNNNDPFRYVSEERELFFEDSMNFFTWFNSCASMPPDASSFVDFRRIRDMERAYKVLLCTIDSQFYSPVQVNKKVRRGVRGGRGKRSSDCEWLSA